MRRLRAVLAVVDECEHRQLFAVDMHASFQVQPILAMRVGIFDHNRIVAGIEGRDLTGEEAMLGRAAGQDRRAAPGALPGIDGQMPMPFNRAANRTGIGKGIVNNTPHGIAPPGGCQLNGAFVASVQHDAVHMASLGVDSGAIDAGGQIHKPKRPVLMDQRHPLFAVALAQQENDQARPALDHPRDNTPIADEHYSPAGRS